MSKRAGKNRFNARNSKNGAANDTANNTTNDHANVSAEVFSFGEPEAVLDSRAIWDYIECGFNGSWYEPPTSFEGLARTFRANTHHETALRLKRNLLVKTFIPHRLLDKQRFSAWVLDYLTFGNAYMERRSSMTQRTLTLKPALAKFVRRCRDLNRYVFLSTCYTGDTPYTPWAPYEFEEGSLFHLIEPDLNQEVYGMPEYLSALQSIWLNEESTLFRRRYYINGSHAGFILYLNDPKISQPDLDAIRKSLKDTKGIGNFKNLFLYSAGGDANAIKLIPIGEVAAKDEFINIKNVSRDDILAIHRVPPQLLGVVPQNSGGFGNIKDATQVFLVNEIVPLQDRLRALNDWAGDKVVDFISVEDYVAQLGSGVSSSGNKLKKATW